MSVIKVTLPLGEIPAEGKLVSFKAPCTCTVTDGIQIEGVTYTVCDALGVPVTGASGVWDVGSIVTVVLSLEQKKAYIQNNAGYSPSNKPTAAELGVAPAGNGYDGKAIPKYYANSDEELFAALDELLATMPRGATKQIEFQSASTWPSLAGYSYVGTLFKDSDTVAVLEGTTYGVNGSSLSARESLSVVTSRLASGWGPFEYYNPPLVSGFEFRTTERVNYKAVFKRWDSTKGVIECRLDGETTWKPYTDITGVVKHYTATVSTSWTASGNYSYQDVAVTGILATDTPIVGINPGSDNAANVNYSLAMSNVFRITTSANSIRLWARSKPTVAIPIQIKVVR